MSPALCFDRRKVQAKYHPSQPPVTNTTQPSWTMIQSRMYFWLFIVLNTNGLSYPLNFLVPAKQIILIGCTSTCFISRTNPMNRLLIPSLIPPKVKGSIRDRHVVDGKCRKIDIRQSLLIHFAQPSLYSFHFSTTLPRTLYKLS